MEFNFLNITFARAFKELSSLSKKVLATDA